MGEYAMAQALLTYGWSQPKTEIHTFEPVECPLCRNPCGGKSGFFGEQGRLEGVHQHLKFKHGIKQKWRREDLIMRNTLEEISK